MLKKTVFLLMIAVTVLFSGCGTEKPLPDGMEADELVKAGTQVALLVIQGDYEGAHALLREDQREACAPEDFQTLALRELDGAGVYKQVQDVMTSGQTVNGETVGVANLYCDFSKKDVLFRLSFDKDMEFVGISIHEQ